MNLKYLIFDRYLSKKRAKNMFWIGLYSKTFCDENGVFINIESQKGLGTQSLNLDLKNIAIKD